MHVYRIRAFSLIPLIILITGILCSCSNIQLPYSDTEQTDFVIPDWNSRGMRAEELPPLSFWIIQSYSDTGVRQFNVTPDVRHITLDLHKNIPAAILAYPITRHSDKTAFFFRPAGCIYPYGCMLSWQDGFAAHILAVLYMTAGQTVTTGSFCSYFNWQRFMSTIHKKEKESILAIEEAKSSGTAIPAYYNPWFLDQTGIPAAIAAKTFSIYSLYAGRTITFTTDTHKTGLLSRYIPENTTINTVDCITVASFPGKTTVFLYKTNRAAVYTTDSTGKTTLAISALPLYTGNQ